MSDITTPTYQNYILYRTVAYMYQPASYTDQNGDKVTPDAIVAQAAGYVIGTQLLAGTSGITVPDGFAYALDAAKNYAVGSIYTPATDYTLTGATTATAGTALTLDLTPNNDGPTGDVTVTLSDGGAGGTFSSSTATLSGCTKTAQTVTYTPKAAGTVTISATNSGSLTNPASLSVTVSAAS